MELVCKQKNNCMYSHTTYCLACSQRENVATKKDEKQGAKLVDTINWKIMHKMNYGGCQYCGGKCTDKNSILEWQRAVNLLCANPNNTALMKKIETKKTF